MARATATCTCSVCGRTFEVSTVRRNGREADSWAEWAERAYTTCPECEQKEREAKAAELAKQAQADGLPELVGSPKQITWAEQIRARYIESSGKELDDILVEIKRHKEAGKYTEGDDLALHAMLVDGATGVLMAQKMIGLPETFSRRLMAAIIAQPIIPDYSARLQKVMTKYSTSALLEEAKKLC